MSDTEKPLVDQIIRFFTDEFEVNLNEFQRDKLAGIINSMPAPDGAGMKHKYFICHLRPFLTGNLFNILDGNGSDGWIQDVEQADKEACSVVVFKIPHRRAFMAVRAFEKFLQEGESHD